MKQILLRLLRFYRAKISPLKPPMCRYYPTCSAYAVEAIETHGAFFGSLLAIRRLLRCNVLFPGGYDPVPPKKNHHHTHTEDDP
ncbi:MAG: membrane protein insertion efficiency factor YidD [Clostridia bacterium]|nr:membrane protein insertion efficiency factor YidD [Clostridia bacterium]